MLDSLLQEIFISKNAKWPRVRPGASEWIKQYEPVSCEIATKNTAELLYLPGVCGWSGPVRFSSGRSGPVRPGGNSKGELLPIATGGRSGPVHPRWPEWPGSPVGGEGEYDQPVLTPATSSAKRISDFSTVDFLFDPDYNLF